jgi:hypothetical protein
MSSHEFNVMVILPSELSLEVYYRLINLRVHQVRGILAQLGFEKLDDIIGRTDILKSRDVQLSKTKSLDLSFLMAV